MPIHAIGNSGSFFDRLDYQPGGRDVFHLNLSAARNWFQIPNQYDQQSVGQDQRQRVLSYNIAPGYQHTFNPGMLLTVNGWVRQDQVHFYPSADIFSDTPATLSQQRRLMSLGGRGELAYTRGKHNLRFGAQIMQTRLAEAFQLGITDPTFNPVCLTSDGDPVTNPGLVDPAACAKSGFQPNPDVQPGLIPFDLTRGGSLFRFNDKGNINEYAFYVTDTINWGNFTLTPGLRITRYDGLSQATGVQPRIGVAYLVKRTGTVLRASYARTLETPGNENLLLSSATGVAGLTDVFGAVGQQPIPAARRNQFNAGFQQTIGRYVQIDADYYWKYANPGYEWDVILTTPITFPIAWKQDKLDGFGIRVSTLNLKGFQVNTTMGYGRLRYFGPEVGGLLFNRPLPTYSELIQMIPFTKPRLPATSGKGTVHGLHLHGDMTLAKVSGGGDALDSILGLTADQQHQMGFFCGNNVATPDNQISDCNLPYGGVQFSSPVSGVYGATRVQIPVPGTADDDHNPPRVATRNVFDIAVGTDNLLRNAETKRIKLQFTAVNVTNKEAMYNFLSTFGGTHFIQPRSYQAKIVLVF